jgi:glyoxylase-like metal-dependent hydrolase (beta-lactamase superfamily II)
MAEVYSPPEPISKERIIAAPDGMTFDLGNNVELRVVETLGHASHHLSYYEPLTEGIFPGDAAGIYLNQFDVTVPTTPAPFRLDIALASLDKLISLKPKFLYYTHFGKADNAMDKLRAYALQLKLWAKSTKQGLANKEDLEAIRRRIIACDKAAQKALGYIEAHPALNQTVLHESPQGFIDFVGKFDIPQ